MLQRVERYKELYQVQNPNPPNFDKNFQEKPAELN